MKKVKSVLEMYKEMKTVREKESWKMKLDGLMRVS